MKTITIKQETPLPGTNIVLEKGDKIRIKENEVVGEMGPFVFKQISDTNWEAFAGAEPFLNGEDPLISELLLPDNENITIVLDNHGIFVSIFGNDFEEDSFQASYKDLGEDGKDVASQKEAISFIKNSVLRDVPNFTDAIEAENFFIRIPGLEKI